MIFLDIVNITQVRKYVAKLWDFLYNFHQIKLKFSYKTIRNILGKIP
jgi:hypothetical protein